jgi:nitroimidazol reductase NimA-like FMN-containing flavoprotein (pyridoxamine 5'-phosphate oxidase superfamily)
VSDVNGHVGASRDHADLEVLPYVKCLELAASQPVGRMAFAQSGGIEVFPVNHRVVGGMVVFRTADGSKLGAAIQNVPVAFEVDAYDATRHEGWSVVIKGRAEEITDDAVLIRLRTLDLPPWRNRAPRPVWIRIRPDEVSGRRL